ncbi:MAG: phosphoadenylyl-sulfate reductase [Anaerolineae bacterium]
MTKSTHLSEIDYAQLNQSFETAAPEDILRWAAETFRDRLAVVTSFQPTGLVTLHMLQSIAPGVTVLTLDTGLLFPETYALIDAWEQRFDFNLIRVRPELTVAQQAEAEGDRLWERDADRCCHIRKTIPLAQQIVGNYGGWITGLRRDQSTSRRHVEIVSWDAKYGNVKLSPLATWTEEMVWTYINAHELPYNVLHDQSYRSIGCFPCTRPVADGEDARAGRWSGTTKTECGIHLPNDNVGTIR